MNPTIQHFKIGSTELLPIVQGGMGNHSRHGQGSKNKDCVAVAYELLLFLVKNLLTMSWVKPL